jgi:hypothetical protein
MQDSDHIVNPEMIKLARQMLGGFAKSAFIPGSDPAMSGGQGGPADAMAGGSPAPGGADPSAMAGGQPPPAGGGGGGDMEAMRQMLRQELQMIHGASGGAGGAAGAASGAPLKPKIDVNVELMQIKNMMAKICDTLGIHIPAQDMVATPDKLMAMSQGQPTGDPAAAAAGSGAQQGAIPPISGMEGMQPAGMPGAQKAGSENGRAFDSAGFVDNGNRAAAIMRVFDKRVA